MQNTNTESCNRLVQAATGLYNTTECGRLMQYCEVQISVILCDVTDSFRVNQDSFNTPDVSQVHKKIKTGLLHLITSRDLKRTLLLNTQLFIAKKEADRCCLD